MELNQESVELFRNVWGSLRVPVRPGSEGLDLYRNQMEILTEKRVLVLGATPELIDMAIELNAQKIVSVERSPEIIEAMKQLGRRDWTNVQLISGDWLEERPEFYSSFNYVACDGGLLFLQYPGHWELLFKLVNRYLTSDGVFVAKEWAEPPGERDYNRFIEEMISRFESESKNLSRDEMIESYTYLASELRIATFIKTTKNDGSFDQDILLKRIEHLLAILSRKYPDSEMVLITQAAFKYLARSQPGTTDVIAGVRFEGANILLASQGFRAEHFLLPDRPIPDANYMFVAHKY